MPNHDVYIILQKPNVVFLQLWTSPGDSLFHKVVEYLRNDWNILEDFAHVLVALAGLLRLVLSEQDFYWVCTVYCVSLAFYFIRVMQVFDVNKTIGPKVIIIREMVRLNKFV